MSLEKQSHQPELGIPAKEMFRKLKNMLKTIAPATNRPGLEFGCSLLNSVSRSLTSSNLICIPNPHHLEEKQKLLKLSIPKLIQDNFIQSRSSAKLPNWRLEF